MKIKVGSCAVVAVCLALACMVVTGCGRRSGSAESHEAVIYTSVDEPFATPLLKRFEQQTGIHVRLVTDTEANKSAGLVERLEAEKVHPQADVYWGNEIFHTINLAEKGAFSAYRPKTAEDVPARWRSKDDFYTGIGLRAHMIVVSTRPEFKQLVAGIHNLSDLTKPSLKGKIAISHPGFGTASGHVAAMDVLWGDAKFSTYMKALRANDVKLLGGNSEVADQIAAGNLVAGLSDNDDINNGKADGQPLDGVIPDQGPGGQGTLLIPTTIALVAHCQHPDDAKKLIDFLCDPSVEKDLIAGKFLALSVRDTSKVKAMDVDYVKCAHQMRHAIETALNILQDRESKTP